jgi:hypothetical protein
MRLSPIPLLLAITGCSSSPAVTTDSTPVVDRSLSDAIAGDAAGPDLPAVDASTKDTTPTPDSAAVDVSVDTAMDAGDPFPTGPTACMGTQGTLTQLGAVGNVTIFGGCKGTSYLLVWGGAAGSLNQTSLSAIKAKHSSALLGVNGVFGHGITSCCVPSTNSVCMSIHVSANTITVWDLAQELDTILAQEPDCFGIVADVPGPASPRCQKGPECLPIPICDSTKNFDPVCCTVPKYDPGAARAPTLSSSSPIWGLELPQAKGECSHDGECVLNGCGNHCVAYTAPTMIAICPCYPALKDSFCGCVGGECVWYEQK